MRTSFFGLFCATLFSALGCTRSGATVENRSRLPAEIITARTIADESELAQLLTQPRVILHLDVDWAFTSIESRLTVVELREFVDHQPEFKDVVFRRIDCTETLVIARILEDLFSDQQATAASIHHGNGSVVWIRDGKLRDYVDNAAKEGKGGLIARTKAAFR